MTPEDIAAALEEWPASALDWKMDAWLKKHSDTVYQCLSLARRSVWQDISTAPEKGSYLGVIRSESGRCGEPFICEWDEELGHVCQFQTEYLPHVPTHWMPLPPHTEDVG